MCEQVCGKLISGCLLWANKFPLKKRNSSLVDKEYVDYRDIDPLDFVLESVNKGKAEFE